MVKENQQDEKRSKIINAAIEIFGQSEYKKAAIADIASVAGVSKGLVFHHFNSKKELYLSVLSYCVEYITKILTKELPENGPTDFFNLIRVSIDIKLEIMSKHPRMLDFLRSSYFESDKELAEGIADIFSNSYSVGFNDFLKKADMSKFRENIDPELAYQMLLWCSEGYINDMSGQKNWDINQVKTGFEPYLRLLEHIFYKEG